MNTNRGILLMILSSAGLMGLAAAQENKPSTIPGWGNIIDLVGDCKIVAKDGAVAITVPSTPATHNLNPLPEYNLLAPRVLQDVSGDFQIEVKVQAFARPEANTAATAGGASYVAAGPVVWSDGKNFIKCFRAVNGDRNDLFIHIEAFKDGVKQPVKFVTSGGRPPDKATLLRIKRYKNDFTFDANVNGRDWVPVASLSNFAMPATVQAGAAVINATKKEVTVQFAELMVTGQ
jgi:hypothetical protein